MKPSKRRRALIAVAIGLPGSVLVLWLLVHSVPGFGPWLADSLRAVFGTAFVAKLETIAYGVEDRFNRLWRKSEPPKAHWQAEPAASDPAPIVAASAPGKPALPPFRPRDVGAIHARMKTPVDGVWVPVRHPGRELGPPILFKTQLHPDAKRPWAELFVVVVDMRRARLHAVAGSRDPVSVTSEAKQYQRPARIPESAQPELLAAFNGGFKTEHGHYGMMVDGVTLVPPRELSCTVVGYQDGSLAIATWKRVADREKDMDWWRQTPPCLYQNGKMHGGLWEEENTGWGAAVGGDVVIRRSAIGIDESGKQLFVGISNHTTARALADGMHHAGAHHVAQLDVNWSFPKFLLYQKRGDKLEAEVLVEGFVYEKDEYLAAPAPRDFFYLVRSEPTAP